VGERTRGGANPREGFPVHPLLELAVPVARASSPRTGASWEGVGVAPDVECPADEALARALGLLGSE
jgi:C-terminal processing protease CtpA/Prc